MPTTDRGRDDRERHGSGVPRPLGGAAGPHRTLPGSSGDDPRWEASRDSIAALLADHLQLTEPQRLRAIASDHVLDAVLCTLAGADFARRRAMPPPAELRELAHREGWIWVRAISRPSG